MNTFFKAVKEGGDMWRIYLPRPLAMAHAGNAVLTNGAKLDDIRMRWCEKAEGKDRRIVQLMPGGRI